MLDAGYRKRLAADLPQWLDAGWVSTDGAAGILASLNGGRRATFGLSAILGMLGALLLGLAVIAFVGSQWDYMPRIVRFGLIVAALLIAYAASFEFERRNLRILAEAGVLAAGLVFAAGIALVGQTYHLSGDFAGAVLLFEAGVLAAALVTGSPTLTVLGLIGSGYWAWIATYDNGVVPHWASAAAIGIGIVVATLQNSHYGRILAILAVMFWVSLTIGGLADAGHWTFSGGLSVYIAAALALWALGAVLAGVPLKRIAALGDAVLWPGLFAILVTFGILQLGDHPSVGEHDVQTLALGLVAAGIVFAGVAYARRGLTLLDVIAVIVLGLGALGFALFLPTEDLTAKLVGGALVLAATLWAVTLGQSGTHPIGKSIGLAAFGIEVVYLYAFTLGTRLDTALAFLGGGVLFIVLAFVLYRIDRILARRARAAAIVADLRMDVIPPVPSLDDAPPAPPVEALAEPLPEPQVEETQPEPTPEPPPTDEPPTESTGEPETSP